MCQTKLDQMSGGSYVVRDCMSCQCGQSQVQHNWVKQPDGSWLCVKGNHG